MKNKLVNLALAGTLISGCGDVEADYQHEKTTVGTVLNEMADICSSTASDVDAVVCPIADDSGLHGFMKLNCWVSAKAGEVSCIETDDERVCRSYSTGDRCKREFESSSVSCDFGESYEIYQPDLSADVMYRGRVPENGLGCSVIGAN